MSYSLTNIISNIKKKEELCIKYSFEYKKAKDMEITSRELEEKQIYLLRRNDNLYKNAEIERLEAMIVLLKYNLKMGI